MAVTTLTLTNLVPNIFEAFDIVARERVGFIPAVSQDFSAERAAIDQTVISPVVPTAVVEDLTIGNTSESAPNQAIGNIPFAITKSRSSPFGINGEQQLSLRNAGTFGTINTNRIAQALRGLTNEIEADIAQVALKASRAVGLAGTTPFGTAADLSDFANVLTVLEDNGAPGSDLHLVLGSAAIANIRGKQSVLFKANEAGTSELLRTGAIGEVEGLLVHQSRQVLKAVPKGTGTSATTNAAGYAVGATSITLAAVGTGSILAGDVITIAGDIHNKYIVKTGAAAVSGATIVLQEPGLQQAVPTSAKALTIVAAATRNLAFQRGAIHLATRAPAMPFEGDSADDIMNVTDPVSGITYEFALYKQKRQVRYEINLAWGVDMIKPEFAVNLLG